MKFELQQVYYMPKDLKPGILYVSEEFATASHLCVCGCGAKIRTPLGPTEWTVEITKTGPSLKPSVGNWQQACQSHYWIYQGKVKWGDRWASEQIYEGRQNEGLRRKAYYEEVGRQRSGLLRRFWRWLVGLIG